MNPKFLLSILATLLLAVSTQAQYTGSNQINTITGVAIDWTGNGSYIVGDNSAYDALVIQSGGVLSNTLGFIGVLPGNNYNAVLVKGSGSVWSNTADLFVGDYGAGNSLTIAGSGAVYNGGNGYVGYQSGASNNTVVVTGNGSVWGNNLGTNEFLGLYVGYADMGNSLTITNGGAVYNDSGYIGYSFGASNNTVLVSGGGSVWSNAIELYVGLSGGGNSLTISNGGAVYNVGSESFGNGYIGYVSDSNTVLVTGSGSVWGNPNYVYVTHLYVGDSGMGNWLTIASSGTVYNYIGYIGYQSAADNNAVLVSGSGSAWDIVDLYVGYSGAGNSLTIASNGEVGANGYIGYQSAASNNTVLVTGNRSFWSSPSLQVGYSGVGNSLTISNGGSVSCMFGVAIGASAGSSNNTVVVAGGGSLVVTNADGDDTLFVSRAGGADSLVLNGGAVTVNQLYLVNGTNSIIAFNAGTLNSGGTIVTTPQNFTVGDGTDAAVFHLLGGEHSFVYGSLEISSNAMLTGCGDINGDVLVDAGGTVLANCGGTLTFSRSVENDGIVEVMNGSVLVADDSFDNEGLIIVIDGSTEFRGGLLGGGGVLTKKEVQISSITRSGNNIIIQIPSGNAIYQLQVSPSLKPATWSNLGASQSGTGGVLTFTDSGGATNRPSLFYHIGITAP